MHTYRPFIYLSEPLIRRDGSLLHLSTRKRSTIFALSEEGDKANYLPWVTVNYYTKKQERLKDKHGNLIHNERTIKEPPAWTRDAKMALAIQVVAREAPNTTEEELRNKLQQLQVLVPDLKPGPTSKHADLVRVAARLDKAAEIMLILRKEFPYLNLSRLAAAWPQLLLADLESLAADVKETKAVLGTCGPAVFRELLEEFPHLLVPSNATALLDNIARLFDTNDTDEEGGRELGWARAVKMLETQPFLARPAIPLRSQTRGERDAEYLADTIRAEM
ncbi:hypothetical protein VaNZ11_005539 [Volvox africanus]|uniref:Uncharacterized protein n=1 Tax=Volvox africanus TaxID=51714 RepID=A0ABQ5RYU1_9CHLO|nr:hypothetical protein VaNZ11_005539 [Volvox africanus]